VASALISVSSYFSAIASEACSACAGGNVMTISPGCEPASTFARCAAAAAGVEGDDLEDDPCWFAVVAEKLM
jgi:hypothetical protein